MTRFFGRRSKAAKVEPRFAVAEMGGGEVELVLYGEVSSEESRDWWSGEKDGRPRVSTENVSNELRSLQSASHVTVRLNSVGGDLYAGIAIYSILKSIDADVTVIIDGIAASAASVIACAGDEVVVNPGSIFMIHEGCLSLFGYYTRGELCSLIDDVDAGVKAMRNVYVAKTGLEEGEVDEMIRAETWLVGQEIIDKGFADTLDSDDEAEAVGQDGGEVVIAGIRHDLSRFRHVPDLAARCSRDGSRMAVSEKRPSAEGAAVADRKSEPPCAAESRKGKCMDAKELREQYPDLVAQIEASAADAERSRISAIDEIAQGLPEDMVRKAKFEDPCTAQELAFEAMKADRKAAARFADQTKTDSEESGVDDVASDPEGSEEDEDQVAKKEVSECAAFLKRMNGVIR